MGVKCQMHATCKTKAKAAENRDRQPFDDANSKTLHFGISAWKLGGRTHCLLQKCCISRVSHNNGFGRCYQQTDLCRQQRDIAGNHRARI